jgi:hypothetical protein
VKFFALEANAHPLFKALQKNYSNDVQNYTPGRWLSFYTDEVSIPGEQVVTSEYKINNSPTYSYATDVIYPEVTITFILDAYMNQKKIFDKWIEYIKPITTKPGLMRLKYRDEYVSNINITKYERFGNSYREADRLLLKTISINPANSNIKSIEPIFRYNVTLHNAFPTTISSVQLSSGSSQLNRVSVNFKYDYPIYSSTADVTTKSIETVNLSR